MYLVVHSVLKMIFFKITFRQLFVSHLPFVYASYKESYLFVVSGVLLRFFYFQFTLRANVSLPRNYQYCLRTFRYECVLSHLPKYFLSTMHDARIRALHLSRSTARRFLFCSMTYWSTMPLSNCCFASMYMVSMSVSMTAVPLMTNFAFDQLTSNGRKYTFYSPSAKHHAFCEYAAIDLTSLLHISLQSFEVGKAYIFLYMSLYKQLYIRIASWPTSINVCL